MEHFQGMNTENAVGVRALANLAPGAQVIGPLALTLSGSFSASHELRSF